MKIQLGANEVSSIWASASSELEDGIYVFQMGEPDLIWRKFVNALDSGSTHADLQNATRFMSEP